MPLAHLQKSWRDIRFTFDDGRPDERGKEPRRGAVPTGHIEIRDKRGNVTIRQSSALEFKTVLGHPIPKLFFTTLVYALSRGLQAALADTRMTTVSEDVLYTFAFLIAAVVQFVTRYSYCAIILPNERE